MLDKSPSRFESILGCATVLLALAVPGTCHALDCPTPADPIVTDRPDVTNSSLVVPLGSIQAENGVDWRASHGSNTIDATNTRLRFGVAHCTEFLIDVPDYFDAVNGSETSGFSNLVVSFKRQLPAPFGLGLSATAGLGFPTGADRIAGKGYQPYIQFPWSRSVADGWEIVGMFTLTWFPSDSASNPTFEPTLSLERELGANGNLFLEYVGDYDHRRPAHLIDLGGAWRLNKAQQIDFHFGAGLNRTSGDHYFGIGYSFRIDGLFRSPIGNSP